jgi:hypothetical protein
MKLDDKDLMAVSRSRVQRGKFVIWLTGLGLLWIVAMLVGLALVEQISALLYWISGSMVAFIIGMVIFMVYIEVRANKLFAKLKKEV